MCAQAREASTGTGTAQLVHQAINIYQYHHYKSQKMYCAKQHSTICAIRSEVKDTGTAMIYTELPAHEQAQLAICNELKGKTSQIKLRRQWRGRTALSGK